jgi:hypothetical protein
LEGIRMTKREELVKAAADAKAALEAYDKENT